MNQVELNRQKYIESNLIVDTVSSIVIEKMQKIEDNISCKLDSIYKLLEKQTILYEKISKKNESHMISHYKQNNKK